MTLDAIQGPLSDSNDLGGCNVCQTGDRVAQGPVCVSDGIVGQGSCAHQGAGERGLSPQGGGTPNPGDGAAPYLIHELKDGSCGSVALLSRLERYQVAKRRSLQMSEFLAAFHDPERAKKLEQCGDWLLFRHYFTIDKTRLAGARFCQQDRLCPFCAMRRASKMLRRYVERVVHLATWDTGTNARLIPVMVNHTIQNGGDLGERLDHLRGGLRRMWERVRNHQRGLGGWTEACRAIGAVRSIEVKRGKNSNEWHPHSHAIWLCWEIPDENKLRDEWNDITGDSHQVKVIPFHYWQRGEAARADNVAHDMQEVFKYALKFSSMTLADNWEAFRKLVGRKLVASRGLLRGIAPPKTLTDDLEPDDLPYVEWVFRWHQQLSAYRQEK